MVELQPVAELQPTVELQAAVGPQPEGEQPAAVQRRAVGAATSSATPARATQSARTRATRAASCAKPNSTMAARLGSSEACAAPSARRRPIVATRACASCSAPTPTRVDVCVSAATRMLVAWATCVSPRESFCPRQFAGQAAWATQRCSNSARCSGVRVATRVLAPDGALRATTSTAGPAQRALVRPRARRSGWPLQTAPCRPNRCGRNEASRAATPAPPDAPHPT